MLKPTDRTVPWKEESILERIDNCRMMLRIHGFLNYQENENVRERIKKWIRDQEGETNEC